LVIDQRFSAGLAEIETGDELLVLTWLDRADREVLTTRVRGDPSNPLTGVFSTRSPDRPNPIGIHRVKVISMVDRTRIQVEDLEALHMTPILDIKPVLSGWGDA
jgi:tRNA-Thr(GGU) m(6)t(6)A37 methyltransferase TsaA